MPSMTIRHKRHWFWRLFSRREKPSPWNRPESRVEVEPWSCPICGCRIEPDGDYYVCVGCRDRYEVDTYLQPLMKDPIPTKDGVDSKGNVISMSVVPPCGWRGRADGLGKTWTSHRP